jgi:hypothetical protein
VSFHAGLNGPTTGPDRAELNGSCRACPMGCWPSPSMARLVLWAGPGPLPIVPGCAHAGPNHAGRGPAHLLWAKFSGLVHRPGPQRPIHESMATSLNQARRCLDQRLELKTRRGIGPSNRGRSSQDGRLGDSGWGKRWRARLAAVVLWNFGEPVVLGLRGTKSSFVSSYNTTLTRRARLANL